MRSVSYGKHPATRSREPARLLAYSLVTLMVILILPATATASGAPAAGIENVKQIINEHVAGSDSGLSAPDIASYINDYGVPGTPTYGPEALFELTATATDISASALSDSKFIVAYTD